MATDAVTVVNCPGLAAAILAPHWFRASGSSCYEHDTLSGFIVDRVQAAQAGAASHRGVRNGCRVLRNAPERWQLPFLAVPMMAAMVAAAASSTGDSCTCSGSAKPAVA